MAVEDVRRVRSVGVEDVLRAGASPASTARPSSSRAPPGRSWRWRSCSSGSPSPLFTSIWGLVRQLCGLDRRLRARRLAAREPRFRPTADRIGRRRIFQTAILWYAVFTALTALAWGPGRCRPSASWPASASARCSSSTRPCWPSTCPRRSAAASSSSSTSSGRSGSCSPPGSPGSSSTRLVATAAWRWLFLAASFPAFLAFVARVSLPESPYYLARKGRQRGGGRRPRADHGHAGRRAGARYRSRAELVDPSSSSPRRLRSRTAIILLVWIALNISYYGLFLWLPFVLQDEARFSIERLPAAGALRALAVPGLCRGDLARGADRPQAHTRALSASRRRVGVCLRRLRVHAAVRRRALLRRVLQPRRLGSRVPLHAELFPPGCAAPRSAWRREWARARRSAAPTSSARSSTPPARRPGR